MEYGNTAFYEARLDVNKPIRDDGSPFMIHASWGSISELGENQIPFDAAIIKRDALRGFVEKVIKMMIKDINNLNLLKKELGY